MAMSVFSTNVFAQLQEVRGIETRRVIYEGPSYKVIGLDDHGYDNKYYGWEFVNRNSISVSVDIELCVKYTYRDEVIKTKSIVLKPGEKYILKFEDYTVAGVENNKYFMGSTTLDDYYVKYKAYKLQ